MNNLDAYPFEIHPLTEEDGGGFLISFPDFSECISDGETIDEAIANGRDALAATIATLREKGFSVPEPNGAGLVSAKLLARIPSAMRSRLSARAEKEGLSPDALVLDFIAEGLARRESRV